MKKLIFSSFSFLFFFGLLFQVNAAPIDQLTIKNFLQTLSQPNPDLTGGAAISTTLAISASLCAKVAALNIKHQNNNTNWLQLKMQSQGISRDAMILAQQDTDDFKAYLKAIKNKQGAASLRPNSQILSSILQKANQLMKLAQIEQMHSSPLFQSDAAAAYELAFARTKAIKKLIKYDTTPNKNPLSNQSK